MYAFVQDKTLPRSVSIDGKKYAVLGYYNIGKTSNGSTVWQADKTKVVIQHDGCEPIVTNWPMSIYKSITKYEEES